jgi:hypothetical protein
VFEQAITIAVRVRVTLSSGLASGEARYPLRFGSHFQSNEKGLIPTEGAKIQSLQKIDQETTKIEVRGRLRYAVFISITIAVLVLTPPESGCDESTTAFFSDSTRIVT